METKSLPRSYPEWRKDPIDREQDAAYVFGYDLVRHCRDSAIQQAISKAPQELQAPIQQAVDMALHNLLALLEGFYCLESGPTHKLEYALHVIVRDSTGRIVERQQVSPCKQDLPIGYHKWSRHREFR